MKRVLKVLAIIFAIVAVIIGGFVAYILFSWDKTFAVATVDLEASTDPEVLARGEYLFQAAAACAHCHGEDLSGGKEFVMGPVGTLRTPNVSSHDAGIGDLSDGIVGRAIRNNMRPDDRAMFPLMEYNSIADEDLLALVSYMRASAPSENVVEDHDYGLLGKAILTFAIEPVRNPDVRDRPKPGRGLAYGEYLANYVSLCVACHTEKETGGPRTGDSFAGGYGSPVEDGDGSEVIVTPNLTPDPETGIMHGWTETEFLTRMRDPKPSAPGSTMPWATYAKMTNDDLLAIYDYLNSLEPVHQPKEPGLQPKD